MNLLLVPAPPPWRESYAQLPLHLPRYPMLSELALLLTIPMVDVVIRIGLWWS